MIRSNRVAETKALISFAVTASLFSHMQKKRPFHDGTPNFPQIQILKKLQPPFLIGIIFRHNEPKKQTEWQTL